MLLTHIKGLLTDPNSEWQKIESEKTDVKSLYTGYVMPLALISPVCALIGTTTMGWRIGAGSAIKLTFSSALMMAVAVYFAMLVATFVIGKLIQWMGETYGAKKPASTSIALAAYTATPLFLVGIVQLMPTLWFNFVVGLPALAYTVYLLYSGVPTMMGISTDRGYLFSTSILAVGLVTLVGLLAVTASLWGLGLGPRFTS